MKKFVVVLLFIIGFIFVFTVSAIVAFNVIGGNEVEEVVVTESNVAELPESGITKVTPGINAGDAVVTHSEEEFEAARKDAEEEEKVTEKATEKPTEKKTEKATEKATEKKTEKATEKATEKKTEKVTEKATEKATEKKEETKEPDEKVTQAPMEKETEKETERPKLDPNKQYSDTGL